MTDQTYTFERFKADGDPEYIASKELASAVNAALAVEMPLVVSGEPGTGKTTLAASIAKQLECGEVLRFATRSEHQGRDCLYTFDALGRLHDVQARVPGAEDPKSAKHVHHEALGEAIAWPGPKPRVVLIDEIDKASRDFPNDLLEALDAMRFTVRETGEEIRCTHRPIVVVTSNSERQLPEAFLRRCVYHHIEFPKLEELKKIVEAHLKKWRLDKAKIEQGFVDVALARFDEARKAARGKPPATGELLTWVKVLLRAGIGAKSVEHAPFSELHPGTLAKLKSDLDALLTRPPPPAKEARA